MVLNDLLGKTCLIGLSYFDDRERFSKKIQHSGRIVHVDGEMGVSVEILATSDEASLVDAIDVDGVKFFILPSTLSPWVETSSSICVSEKYSLSSDSPDYLVDWEIYQRNSYGRRWLEWQPIVVSDIKTQFSA